MKKIYILCFLFLFSNKILAQAPSSDENSLLWRISGNGLKFASYLYGTIHVIPKKDFFITDSTKWALGQSENVAFEFNLKKEMRLLPQLRLMFKMRMKGDTTLDMLLDEEDYEFVKRKFENKRIPMRLVNRVKPSLISDLAGSTTSDMRNGETTSYEMEFLQRAKDADKIISGLETASYQLSVFDSIPYKVQAQMMVDELRDGGTNSGKEYKKLLKIYKRQDLQALAKVMGASDEMNAFNDIMLFHRNRNWIPVIEKMSKKYKMFYAVGAGHLVGEKGVVALLRQKGYILTAIR